MFVFFCCVSRRNDLKVMNLKKIEMKRSEGDSLTYDNSFEKDLRVKGKKYIIYMVT